MVVGLETEKDLEDDHLRRSPVLSLFSLSLFSSIQFQRQVSWDDIADIEQRQRGRQIVRTGQLLFSFFFFPLGLYPQCIEQCSPRCTQNKLINSGFIISLSAGVGSVSGNDKEQHALAVTSSCTRTKIISGFPGNSPDKLFFIIFFYFFFLFFIRQLTLGSQIMHAAVVVVFVVVVVVVIVVCSTRSNLSMSPSQVGANK